MTFRPDATPLGRDSAWSYRCAGCGRCCHGKRIPLTPYDVLRLARGLGVSTTDVLRDRVDGGALAADTAGACTFLEGTRCAAHVHRPLACRLYPLGRVVSGGREVYAELTPDPATEGVYGADGTVRGWLEAQGAAPYLEAQALYLALWRRLRDASAEVSAEDAARWLLDADAAIRELGGHEPPSNADEAAVEHVRVVTRRFLGG